MKAVIFVDIQNDFLPGGALAVPKGDEVVPVAVKLGKAFELSVATQDWHPANHQSFASQHPGKKVGELTTLHGLPQVLWPDHCVQNSKGARLADIWPRAPQTEVVRKGEDPKVDSYSGFFDNGQRHATELEKWLRDRKVTHVYVLGLATDYCVKFTALDAQKLGFVTTLVVDGCRGVNLRPRDSEEAIAEMRAKGVVIATSEEVLR